MKKNEGNRRANMKKGIYILPNLFTTASLFCGFYSVIASVQGNYHSAAIAVIIAFFLDGLDGKIARFTNTSSKFGAEYDSLSDLIAFGVAPALLAYTWALAPFGRYGWLAAFLFVACGALRLARFNIQIGIVDSKLFNGLPIPGAALVVATTVLFYQYLGRQAPLHQPVMLLGMVVLAMLMVSNVKYYSFKDLNIFTRKPFMTFVSIIFLLVIVVLEPQIMFFAVALTYAFSGPLFFIAGMFRRKSLPQGDKEKLERNNT